MLGGDQNFTLTHTHTQTDTHTQTHTHTHTHIHTEAYFITLVFLRKCRNKTNNRKKTSVHIEIQSTETTDFHINNWQLKLTIEALWSRS